MHNPGPLRETAAIELARLGGEAVVDGLLPLLRSDDAAIRNIAIDILKELPDEVAPVMDNLIRESDPDVRIFLVNVLEELRHPRVEDWLIAVLDADDKANVVATAINLLNEIGTAAAEGVLLRAIDRFRDEPFIVFSAENALSRIRSGA